MSNEQIHAVLTGDLIKSSKLDPADLEKVRRNLLAAAGEVKRWREGLVESETEFFRGDSWQLLLSDPGQALRVALFLRACLRAQGLADSRIAVGIGTVSSIAPGRVSLSTGRAFEMSGQALDTMSRQSRMAFTVGAHRAETANLIPLVVKLCDALVEHWTQRQAEAVRLAVVPHEPTHETIAGKLVPTVSKQAVSKLLDGAGWHALRSAIVQFEKLDWREVSEAPFSDNL